MKYSDDLYQLIQTLSQSEKRYIKLVIKAFTSKGTEKQVALFDAFDKQKEYDELKIRADFSTIIAAKNFHVAKNRLYNLILKALYLFHSNSSEKEKNRQAVFQAKVLLQKGLYKQADNITEKCIKTAREIEDFPTAVAGLTEYSNSVFAQRAVLKMQELVNANLAEEMQLLQDYEESLQYFNLQKRVLLMTHQHQMARSEADIAQMSLIQQDPLLTKAVEEVSSEIAQKFYYTLNGLVARYMGDYEQAAKYWSYFVTAFETIKKPTSNDVYQHVKNLNNMMFLYLEANNPIAAWDSCRQLEEVAHWESAKSSFSLTNRINARVVEFKLEYYLCTEQYEEGLNYLEENKILIQAIFDTSDAFRKLVIEHYCTAIYLSNGVLAQANEMVLNVLDNKVIKKHPYIYSEAMLFNILIHFELEHYQLLDSMLLNTYRMLSKSKSLYQTERVVFKYLKKHLKMPDNKLVLDSLELLKGELESIRQDKFEKKAFPTFDLIRWVESKLNDTTMVEIMQKKK